MDLAIAISTQKYNCPSSTLSLFSRKLDFVIILLCTYNIENISHLQNMVSELITKQSIMKYMSIMNRVDGQYQRYNCILYRNT